MLENKILTTHLPISFSTQHLKPNFTDLAPGFRRRLLDPGDNLTTMNRACDAVRLLKLSPGSRIKEHTDYDLDLQQGKVRLHIPVTTNPDVEFYLNGKQVVMNAGECWYLRLSDPPRVTNRGQTDRVHMVIDASVDSWLQHLFSQVGLPKSIE